MTRNTDYAVRALFRLALAGGELVSSRALAERERIPLPYLRRILQTLRSRGLIAAAEGKRGGVRLRRPAGRIALSDLIEIFQGRPRFSACVFRENLCRNQRTCPLRKRLKMLEGKMLRELSAVTIADLLADRAQFTRRSPDLSGRRRDAQAQRKP